VVIAVSDWERSNAFYRDVCGAELVELTEPPPTRWRYRFGDINFNVHGPGMAPDPVARIPAQPGMADLCLVWPGTAEQAIQHLQEHGVGRVLPFCHQVRPLRYQFRRVEAGTASSR
jgi:catechol 2,3-dioxygenase-like lactoylglutathione lyase family enzyme